MTLHAGCGVKFHEQSAWWAGHLFQQLALLPVLMPDPHSFINHEIFSAGLLENYFDVQNILTKRKESRRLIMTVDLFQRYNLAG